MISGAARDQKVHSAVLPEPWVERSANQSFAFGNNEGDIVVLLARAEVSDFVYDESQQPLARS